MFLKRSFFKRAISSLRRRIKYNLHPRAIIWKYWQRRCPEKPIITRLGKDLKVRIYPHDVIGKSIYVDGVFEPEVWGFVKNYLRPGMVVFDLGANLGQYTLLSARCVGEKGQVHCFEPSERIFTELQFNVENNNFSDICTLNNVAVSDKEGIAQLSKYQPGGEVYGSLGSQNWASDSKIVGHEEVRTITLDTYVKKQGINDVHLIKMDIEGAELLALRGADELLSKNNSPAIVLELADLNTSGFGYEACEILDYLKNMGYHLYPLDRKGHIHSQTKLTTGFIESQNIVAIKPAWKQ